MSKDKQTPSSEVDQQKLLNDKVEKARQNKFEDNHIQKVTTSGAQGE